MSEKSIIEGILRVQQSNCDDMVLDPEGPYPACRNMLYTFICERCGRDVRNTTDACPSVPKEKRWRFRQSTNPSLTSPDAT